MIPANLLLLQGGEDDLRQKSLCEIESNDELRLHVSMIESCMDMLQHIRQNSQVMTEDQIIIALLGSSVFNSLASAFRLLLSGYYQASGLPIRYVVETGWLISYLRTDDKLVQEWKNTPEDKRQVKFRPGLIRDKLDLRDGLKEKKREAHYKRLCVLCGHPTFASFSMLRPFEGADAMMGPFLVSSLLKGCLEELVQASLIAVPSIIQYFPPATSLDLKARISFIRTRNDWLSAVYGKSMGVDELANLEKAIAALD